MPSAQAQTAIEATITDRQAEAIGLITALNREQQGVFLETGGFLKRSQDSFYEVLSKNGNYTYSLVTRPTSTVVWAIADRPELKSYIGRVVAVKSLTGDANLQTIICENNRSGVLRLPTPRIDTNLKLVCAPGTTLREPGGTPPFTKGLASEGKVFVGTMNRAQQAYVIEMGQFSSTFEPLGIGIKPMTERYEYSIQASEKSTLQYGIARYANLKSYVGIVTIVQSSFPAELTTYALLCENIQPGPSRPATPTISAGGQPPVCAAGTVAVMR